MVWISEVAERRKPSLSASRIATSETSGRSRPSRSKLTPTSTSNAAFAQFAQDLHALDGVQFRVQPFAAQAGFAEVAAQVLRQALGQRRDQHALVLGRPFLDFLEQIGHLAARRPDVKHADRPAPSAGSPARPPRRRSDPARRPPASPTCTASCLTRFSHSSNRSGRLSRALGRRKPCSTSVSLRL